MTSLDVRNMTRRQEPRLPYKKAVETILPGWDISLVFVGSARAKTLNKKLRNKSYVSNVLSYETGLKSGEIIICLDTLAKQAPAHCLLPSVYCLFLFIHALMHLKGHRHSATMERLERAYLARLTLSTSLQNETTYRNRHRHRNAPHTRRRR